MELSINYSTQAAGLLAEGRISLDRFKCPDWPDLIAEAGHYLPLAVHFGLDAGSGKLSQTNWGTIEQILESTGTRYVNLHLDPRLEDYPGFAVDTPDTAQFEAVCKRLLEDVRAATNHFGAQRVILENVPYRGTGGNSLRPAVEPAAIRQIMEATGAGLLLDIAHARIAAFHLGWDEREYMSQLPVTQLRELHFAGLHRLEAGLLDHLSILDTDWPVLEWVLERIRCGEWSRPGMLAFEYGGVGEKFAWRSSAQVIAEQVPRLAQMVKDI